MAQTWLYNIVAGEFQKDKDGGWVKHFEHIQEIHELQKEILQLRKELKDRDFLIQDLYEKYKDRLHPF